MVDLSFSDAAPIMSDLSERLKHMKPTPIFFYPYIKRVLSEAWEKENPVFPMDIKIPKSNKYLLRKDFEPEYVIHLEEPVKMSDGTPIWFENTMDQAYFRCGYENMDARFVSRQKIDMEFIRATCSATSSMRNAAGPLWD